MEVEILVTKKLVARKYDMGDEVRELHDT